MGSGRYCTGLGVRQEAWLSVLHLPGPQEAFNEGPDRRRTQRVTMVTCGL